MAMAIAATARLTSDGARRDIDKCDRIDVGETGDRREAVGTGVAGARGENFRQEGDQGENGAELEDDAKLERVFERNRLFAHLLFAGAAEKEIAHCRHGEPGAADRTSEDRQQRRVDEADDDEHARHHHRIRGENAGEQRT